MFTHDILSLVWYFQDDPMRRCLLLFLLLLAVHPLSADSTVVDVSQVWLIQRPEDEYESDQWPIYIMPEPAKPLRIEQVSSPEMASRFYRSDTLQMKGLVSDYVWYRIAVANRTGSVQKLYIIVSPNFWFEAWQQNSMGQWQNFSNGLFYPLEKAALRRYSRHVALWVNDAPNQIHYLYFRVHIGRMRHLPYLVLWARVSPQKAFEPWETTAGPYILTGAICILLALAIYNGLVGWYVRDKVYLYYVLLLVAYAVYTLAHYNSLGPILGIRNVRIIRMAPDSYIYQHFDLSVIICMGGLLMVLLNLFAGSFLQIREYAPHLRKWLLASGLLSQTASVIYVFYDSFHLWVNIILGLNLILVLFTALAIRRTNRQAANYFLNAHVVPFTLVILLILHRANLMASQPFTPHLFVAAIVVQGLMLSLAVAGRINLMRKQIEQQQAESEIAERNRLFELQQLTEQKNKELEIKVAERTEELQVVNEELSSTVDFIEQQRNELQRKTDDIKSSINYASRIQSAILPRAEHFERLFGTDNYFIYYRPRDIVSGDFYWLAEKDDGIIIAAADCTGHGVPGALMSMIGDSLLTHIVHDKETHRPDLILNRLQEGVRAALRQTENDGRDGMDIALCHISRQSLNNVTVQFAGAMNPLYYTQVGILHEIKGTKLPIGGGHRQHTDKQDPFALHTLSLSPGDCIYLFSDGFADQFGGPDNKKFMSRQFRHLLQSVHAQPMPIQYQLLDSTMKSWMEYGNEPQTDDMLVIGIRI